MSTTPTSSPQQKRSCNFCDSDFSLLSRKRRCRYCNNYFCSDCCSIKATYPVSFQFSSPQWACNNCMPDIFELRSSFEQTVESPATSRKNLRSSSNSALIDGSFHTSYEGSVHTAFKMADPVCRLVFRFSGMYKGGKFDRSTLGKAMKLNKAVVKLPSVGNVERYPIQVPVHVLEEDWKFDKIYKRPPFIKRKRRKSKKNKKRRKSAKDDLKDELRNSSSDSDVPTDIWDEISVFVYQPKELKEDESLPVLIWYHGGGFCIGSIEDSMYETICRTFCNKIRCIVVSVEYRLAPEFTFPVPLEDSYWALMWVYAKGKELFNADVSRISVAGDSAGGSLSALMCIMSKLRNGPKITHQVLVYPCLANPCNDKYESQATYKNGPLLTRSVMQWFMKQCLGDSDKEPEYLFPLLLDDDILIGLPPATIINAKHDPLSDHGTEYFRKLQRINVPVRHTVYGKSIHGFFGSQIGESDEALMEATMSIKLSFEDKETNDKEETDDNQGEIESNDIGDKQEVKDINDNKEEVKEEINDEKEEIQNSKED